MLWYFFKHPQIGIAIKVSYLFICLLTIGQVHSLERERQRKSETTPRGDGHATVPSPSLSWDFGAHTPGVFFGLLGLQTQLRSWDLLTSTTMPSAGPKN